MDKALQYAYRDRRNKKRDFRGLWIQRINAGVREHGLTYAKFIDGLKKANIEVNRKILSEIAFHEPIAFKSIVEKAKASLAS
jgi:large subunit ribosomal protein L20